MLTLIEIETKQKTINKIPIIALICSLLIQEIGMLSKNNQRLNPSRLRKQ